MSKEERKEGRPEASGSGAEGETEERSSDGGESSREDSKGKEGKGKEKEKQKEDGKEGKQEKDGEKEKPSTAEWAVGIACGFLVLAVLGYLFYHALSGPELPPMVGVRAERVLPMPAGGYVVEFVARNEGSQTAANLSVEGVLKRDTVVVEKSSTVVAYVPAETEREGGLYFTKDPRDHRLELRATGYDRP